jgi:hypothetical protein
MIEGRFDWFLFLAHGCRYNPSGHGREAQKWAKNISFGTYVNVRRRKFFLSFWRQSISLAWYQSARTMPRTGGMTKRRWVIVALHNGCLLYAELGCRCLMINAEAAKNAEVRRDFFLSSSATLRVLCVKILSLKRLSFQNQLGVKRHGGLMQK